MRLLYFVLYIILKYPLRIFYPRVHSVNSPKNFFGRTIYVSNHAASFMDPLVIASFRNPIVFFLTRSDVFTPISKPILWAAHMLPIYRQHDGVDTKDENQKTFESCAKILNFGRNLLIFGEGFTDDVFVRRLKPIKKGAVRIGFSSLEYMQWKKKVYIAAVGCNYQDPNTMRSDFLISTSDRICLNDFKDAYYENPTKVINELTKRVEDLMKAQITHVERVEWCEFHENVMRLTRKGMNALNSDRSISLKKRWHYSQNLASWLNSLSEEERDNLQELKTEMSAYFEEQNSKGINENYVFELSQKKKLNRLNEAIKLIFLAPFAILGLLHCGIPYFGVKKFVESSFKRKVFWGSVKLILGMIFMGVLNIPFIFLFEAFIYPSYILGMVYYGLVGLFGLAAYMWWINFKRFKEKGAVKHTDLSQMIETRKKLLQKIHTTIPVA
jgi:1-acyl-sn-glycerol-3-phosphate acyltransferase